MSEQTCATHGHLYGASGQCLFCADNRSAGETPAPQEATDSFAAFEMAVYGKCGNTFEASRLARIQTWLASFDAVEAENTRLRAALEELHAMVWGECPSLLNEDSGGNARLDLEIRAALKGDAQ